MKRTTDKPELGMAIEEQEAQRRAEEDRLAAIGWPEYQSALRGAENAAAAYRHAGKAATSAADLDDAAKDYLRAAAALEAAREQYPLAAEYAKAVTCSESSDHLEASAGRRAMEAIRQGADPDMAVRRMVEEWLEIRDHRDEQV